MILWGKDVGLVRLYVWIKCLIWNVNVLLNFFENKLVGVVLKIELIGFCSVLLVLIWWCGKLFLGI